MDLFFRSLMALFGFASVVAAGYNLLTARTTAKQLAKERRDDERLDEVCLLAATTEQRVTGLETIIDGMERRVEKRLDQIAGDVSATKEMFTRFLLNNHKS